MPKIDLKKAVKQANSNSGSQTKTTSSTSSSTTTTTSSSTFNTTSTQTSASESESSSLFKAKDKKSRIKSLNLIAQASNAKDTDDIHGLSDREYIDLYKEMDSRGIHWNTDLDGIRIKNPDRYASMSEEEKEQYLLHFGNFHSITKAAERQIGKAWCYDEIAASHDSVLDLVLAERFQIAMKEIFGTDKLGNTKCLNWKSLQAAAPTLKSKYGIVFEKRGLCAWISLVDENDNVIQDENGKLAQYKITDAIMPDGLAENAELHCSALVDAMGYDLISVTDFTPEEYELIKEMAMADVHELGTASDVKAYGNYSANYDVQVKDASNWIQNSRKSYWAEFNAQHHGHGYSGEYDGSGVSGMIGEVDNKNASIYYNADGSLKSKSEIIRSAQEALNNFVDDALYNNDTITIKEATSDGNKRLKLEKLGLKYTGYKKDRIVKNSAEIDESSDKTIVYTNALDAQHALNDYADKLMEKDSSLTSKEAADKATKKLNIEKFDLEYTGGKNKQELN